MGDKEIPRVSRRESLFPPQQVGEGGSSSRNLGRSTALTQEGTCFNTRGDTPLEEEDNQGQPHYLPIPWGSLPLPGHWHTPQGSTATWRHSGKISPKSHTG